MAIVKIEIDWWAGFVPVAPEGCEIKVDTKLHEFPQDMWVEIPVTKNWSHPAGVRCYIHTLDEQGNLLDVRHGEVTSCGLACLFDNRDETQLNWQYENLVTSIPEVKKPVDNLLSQMKGKWYRTYKDAHFLKQDYHKVSV